MGNCVSSKNSKMQLRKSEDQAAEKEKSSPQRHLNYHETPDLKEFKSIGDIIELQSILRGYIDRKAIQSISLAKSVDANILKTAASNDHQAYSKSLVPTIPNTNEVNICPNNISETQVPDYLTAASGLAFLRLGPYTVNVTFKDNEPRIKRGPVEVENGNIYIGEWNNNDQRHGFGIQVWNDGARYDGFWLKDKMSIKGRYIFGNGDVYEGEFKNGYIHGFGVCVTFNGGRYEGYWKENLHHGKGTEKLPNGSIYSGDYSDGLKNGIGKFEWADGSTYVGEFKDNDLHGDGMHIQSDGRRYIGEWVHNKMEGKGTFTWPDGRLYKGDYVDDKKQGYGVFKWPNGISYEGEWQGGKQHGIGKKSQLGKRTLKGEWEDGKRVKWIK